VPEALDRLPLHPVNRLHLDALTGELGVMQHAVGSVPDPAHGYCVDDVARALQVDLLHARVLGWAAVADSARRSLRFLQSASRGAGGRFHNFRLSDGSWAAGAGSEDSQARAMLALGETIAAAPPGSILEDAIDLWERALPSVRRPTALRAHASLVLACAAVLSDRDGGRGNSLAATMLEDLATRLDARFELAGTATWPWPEAILTYENALLPRALIVGGGLLGSTDIVATGLAALDWLIAVQTAPEGHLSTIGNGWWPRGGRRSRFDQQPIEATALLLAAEAAHAATAEPRYREAMEQAYGWFLGQNDNGSEVADPVRGAGRDGLTKAGVNTNEGAESTLMWLIAAEHIRTLREATMAGPARAAGTEGRHNVVIPQHQLASNPA
jgi:hypothetical protein